MYRVNGPSVPTRLPYTRIHIHIYIYIYIHEVGPRRVRLCSPALERLERQGRSVTGSAACHPLARVTLCLVPFTLQSCHAFPPMPRWFEGNISRGGGRSSREPRGTFDVSSHPRGISRSLRETDKATSRIRVFPTASDFFRERCSCPARPCVTGSRGGGLWWLVGSLRR